MKHLRPLTACSLAGLLALWFIITRAGVVGPLFLPTPASFASSLLSNLRSGDFWLDIIMSTARVVEAFVASIVVAVPISIAMARSRIVEALLAPYIDFLRYLPVPALIPLTILLFGVDELAKVALLFVGTCFQMIVLVVDDLHGVPQEYRDLIASLGLNGLRKDLWIFREVLPRFYDHSRVLVGWCWTYVIIAELVAAEHGLGHLIKEAQRLTNTPLLYVGITVMGILGVITDLSFKQGYSKLFPYTEPKMGRA